MEVGVFILSRKWEKGPNCIAVDFPFAFPAFGIQDWCLENMVYVVQSSNEIRNFLLA